MASSEYPLSVTSAEGKELLQMAARIRAIQGELAGAAVETDCPDHGFRDGNYDAYLELAAELLERVTYDYDAKETK